MSKTTYKIYCLKDPITDDIRYIGITQNDLTRRLWGHTGGLQNKKNRNLAEWIIGLKDNGLLPIIELIEEGEYALIAPREGYWIKYYDEAGYCLLNAGVGRKRLFISIPNKTFDEFKAKYGRSWSRRVEELIEGDLS